MPTLQSLLAAAARLHATGDTALVGSEVRDFAQEVLNLLSDDGEECGMPMPTVVTETRVKMGGVVHDREVLIPSDACGPWTPADARGFARAVFVAADRAEGKS